MLRFQPSWLVENLMNNLEDFTQSPSWFFPCLYEFTPLEWLGQRNTNVIINSPIHSQAVLFKSWFSNGSDFPQEDILKAFNQILMKSSDININPFKAWLDEYFSKEQLNYLFYWREAASELDSQGMKETFLAIVSQVINYWLGNNKAGLENHYQPDEILSYYYKRYRNFSHRISNFKITEKPVESISAENCSLAVFNLLFNDEDYLEDEASLVYNAWINGYTDLEESKKNIKDELQRVILELGTKKNFEFYKNHTENAKTAAFCWSGRGITPKMYERLLVEPLQQMLSAKYAHSKLVYKAIAPAQEIYDYILLFY